MPISPAETLEAMQWLHGHYASPQGLARPNGLSINGRPDFEGVAAWILDVFLNSRLANHSVPTSKHNVVCAIERTSEWQAKHPGQALQVGTPYQPTLTIDRGEFLRTLHRLDVYYTSWNGLQRPNGMSINGAPDFEAIAAWVFGVYLNARLSGQSPETSWDRIIAIIQSTVEWQSKQRSPPMPTRSTESTWSVIRAGSVRRTTARTTAGIIGAVLRVCPLPHWPTSICGRTRGSFSTASWRRRQ
jgi:hypothetical protein